ncbi:MAG: hypothetical protein Q8S84_01145 [bacterium]|nr:hypothetical protein [bacterium]
MLNNTNHQINHNSSIITENMKSHCTSGRYQNFCIDHQNHNHLNQPLQIAISACSV